MRGRKAAFYDAHRRQGAISIRADADFANEVFFSTEILLYESKSRELLIKYSYSRILHERSDLPRWHKNDDDRRGSCPLESLC